MHTNLIEEILSISNKYSPAREAATSDILKILKLSNFRLSPTLSNLWDTTYFWDTITHNSLYHTGSVEVQLKSDAIFTMLVDLGGFTAPTGMIQWKLRWNIIYCCFANSGLGWKMRCLIFIWILFFVRSSSSSPDYSYDDDYYDDYEGERNN